MKNINKYQEKTRRTRSVPSYDGDSDFDIWQKELLHAALGIASEAGEIADPIKKHVFYNQDLDTENIKEELGDILFYIAWLADISGIRMSDVLNYNNEKLQKRYPDGFTEKAAFERADKKNEPYKYSTQKKDVEHFNSKVVTQYNRRFVDKTGKETLLREPVVSLNNSEAEAKESVVNFNNSETKVIDVSNGCGFMVVSNDETDNK